MTENQNTNQELSFTLKELTTGMQTFIDMKENSIYHYQGLTQQEMVCLVLTEFLTFTNKEQYRKNNRYQEYLKLKAEFEGTDATSVVKEQPKDTPWYPDNSGEWVEVEIGKGKPNALDSCTIIEVLSKSERNKKGWSSSPQNASFWGFKDVVAYKKVK